MSKRSLVAQIRRLDDLSVGQLRERYRDVFGQESRSRNKDYLRKRVAWGIQARAEGGLSERAEKRAAELADELHIRVRTPPPAPAPEPTPVRTRDPRLPPPGGVIRRRYKGRVHEVTAGEDDFTYQGRPYPSLSAVAKRITGSHRNGYRFFRLEESRP
ncbi:DUF2924 domain-containing protein [Haliangium ochraceum]|uniref:Putative bacteriophage related protein n=1 Tax=Haliangium ochraceum (strain DSM 14365 / JCM 11303 / SMP-2) TaxID=502025 RepID=D0LNE8_HALO1|nr:DUF2924 domain-containing protein [Haliangium ochraceum]ACY15325.1 putative bacteriophage related protein [Haliangium ochraceum DSM 14365]